MELWIRSQDGYNLFNCNDITLKERTKYEPQTYPDTDIIGEAIVFTGEYNLISGNKILGIYKSKERALEVLDEIQRLIKSASNEHNQIFPTVVFYEMPKD